MLFLLSKMPKYYPVLALIATNLVISMPAPPSKRSSENLDERNGFSSVPKILEIQLPLKIATKDDLVAWAKYVMGLMASKINITLTTVKEPAPMKTATSIRPPDNVRSFDNAKQPQDVRNSAYQSNFDRPNPNQINGVRHFANSQSMENSRYAANVRNLGHAMNFDRPKVPATVRILENARQQENSRKPAPNANLHASKEKIYATSQLPAIAITGVTTNNFFNNRQLQPTFPNIGVSHTTIPSPVEITANINVPSRSRIKEALFKGAFDSTNSLKPDDQQLFIPSFPDFGPVFDAKDSDAFRNVSVITPPPRTYLPVTTTTDSLKFPTDPFVTRYFFDGVERNTSSNLAVFPSEVALTTHNPSTFSEELPLPVKSLDLLSQQRNASNAKPLFNVPFEAVITFTRDGEPIETTTFGNDRGTSYFAIPTRVPLDQFPPYFDNNYANLTNESGQINVVLDDGSRITESGNGKDERRKQEKKKEGSKAQKSKKQKSSKGQTSVISQLLKSFVALRRNNTPSVDLSPPPLNQQIATTTQRIPVRQRVQSPQRTQYYPNQKPSSASKQGRRNQTSLAQQLQDDDDDDGGSKEENDSGEEGNGGKGTNSDEDDANGGNNNDDDTVSDDRNKDDGSNESSSSQSDYDDSSEEQGGSIQAIVDLLTLAAPILEDLSDISAMATLIDDRFHQQRFRYSKGAQIIRRRNLSSINIVLISIFVVNENDIEEICVDFHPETNTNIAEVLEAGIPLIEGLSEGDAAIDLPGVLVPILLQISGGEDGQGDSAAILTPVLRLIAPLIGPLVGPLILPLSRQSSSPLGQGGSSAADLIKSILAPLLQPTGPGKMTPLSNLIAGLVSSLSKNSGPGGISDLTSLVKAIVAGAVAGTSAGSSGPKDSYGAPTGYGTDNTYAAPTTYNSYPSKNQDPLALLGSSIKDILNAILKIVSSLVSALTSVLGASSTTSSDSNSYGPPSPSYGKPSSYTAPPNGAPYMTTRKPERLARM